MRIDLPILCVLCSSLVFGCTSNSNDTDGDSVENSLDNCPMVANPTQLNLDGDVFGDACDSLVDNDADLVDDKDDNCPADYNPEQSATTGYVYLQGDACDDEDSDGIVDALDNCPLQNNQDQVDSDGNGIGDVCDGCQAITLLADITAGAATSYPGDFTVVNNQLYFLANGDDGDGGPWVHTPATGVTELAKSNQDKSLLKDIASLTSQGGILYMNASNGVNGNELWAYNPADFNFTQLTSFATDDSIGGVLRLYALHDRIYFEANDGVHGEELWVYEPANGVRMVADIFPGVGNSRVNSITAAGDQLFFTATDNTQQAIWQFDSRTGVAQSTGIVLKNSGYLHMSSLGESIYFAMDDGSRGKELWSYSQNSGIKPVADINPLGDSSPRHLTPVDHVLYFTADNGSNGHELWLYDPISGARQLPEIAAGSASGGLSDITELGGTVYFRANDRVIGEALWAYDNANGTRLVLNFPSATNANYLRNLTVANSQLFFTADDGVHGQELWVFDRATGGRLVADLYVGDRDGGPDDLTALGSNLYFSATHLVVGNEPWVYDTTCSQRRGVSQ